MLINNSGESLEERWQSIDDEQPTSEGNITISVTRWLREKENLLSHKGKIGLRIQGDTAIEALEDDLNHFELVVPEFPKYTDGRNFSLARILRKRFHFSGELRASGDILADQLFYLKRVGVDSFDLDEERIPFAKQSLNELSVRYQTSSDIDTTIFQRRG
ncbi:MAG: oxidoreductase [Gammaproteobacteria bacterium]|nr:MAG: oxidoreductase [Gammaproteobacteria bacterium]